MRVTLLSLLLALAAFAEGPQHYGFGLSYLASLEEQDDGTRSLVVYAPPLRAKDGPWRARWRWDKALPKSQASAWIAAGEFRAGGKADLAVVTSEGGALEITLYDAPESFSTRAWLALPAKTRTVAADKLGGATLFVAAGNPFGGERDRIVALVRSEEQLFVAAILAPVGMTGEAALSGREALPIKVAPEKILGFTAGDFWGTGEDGLCVAEDADGFTRLHFFKWAQELSPKAAFLKVASDTAADVPRIGRGGLAAGDFVRDGFDSVALVPEDPAKAVEIRVAPAREASAKPDPGPVYNGRAPSRSPLPGFAGSATALAMTAQPEGMAKRGNLSVAAGVLFGSVRGEPVLKADREAASVAESPDAEIAFVHRGTTPKLSAGAPNFGWPAPGDDVIWQIAVKNNGAKQVAGGAVLRVWACGAPNADVTGVKPDQEFRLEAMEAIDPDKPRYEVVNVTAKWPYGLVDCPGGKWKRLDLSGGEKWLVASVTAEEDANERNNRIEVPWHGWTFHPAFRTAKTLADRKPTVAGDPPSKEYLARKLADALDCAWARGGTTANADVLVRIFFDGYETGWPSDMPEKEKTERWAELRDRYEGVRELDGWWSENQSWERFGWKDGAGELHDTGHLYHPIGDLDLAKATPVRTGLALKGDGRPASFRTHCWGPDLCATKHAAIGLPAAEFAKKYLEGTRGVKWTGWHEMAPDKVFVRVVDRDGAPVPDATVSIFGYGKATALRSGDTNSEGKYDTGHPASSALLDIFSRRHWTSGLLAELTAIVTVTIGDHHDAGILGAEDVAAHGRLALFHRSNVDEREWVWDFRLNWRPGAPPPDFTVEGAVQGTLVDLRVVGPPGAKYRVYRRWEPAYLRAVLGEYETPSGTLSVPLDLSAHDAWGKDRTRAIYEVTRLLDASGGGTTATGESLPRSVSVFAVKNALGLSIHKEGRLLVANNNGDADPYGSIFDGVTPERELLFHLRPAHVARRAVRSKPRPSKTYVTLKSSDTSPPVHFELLDTPMDGVPETRYDLGTLTAKRGTVKEFRVRNPNQLGELNPGDLVTCNAKSARVLSIKAEIVTLEKPLFDANVDVVNLAFTRQPGLAGENFRLRELRDPRGLTTVAVGEAEFLVLCDTGNARLVVWDHTTKYLDGYGGEKFRPCAVASDPRDGRVFFVLDRRPDRKSHLLRLTWTGIALERDHAWNVDTGDWENDEMGLAVLPLKDELDRVRVAITDASKGRIAFFIVAPDRLIKDGEATLVSGAHAGPDDLQAPIDCVYVGARLFAVDGRDRVVEALLPKK